MSGTAIIRTLLAADSALLAVVPADRIKAGVLPLNTAMPAISITSISGVPFMTLKMPTSGNLWTDRVQVTVHAATYPQQKSVLALVRAALPSTRGTVGSFVCDSISIDMEGPDMFDLELSIYSGSQDFLARYIR